MERMSNNTIYNINMDGLDKVVNLKLTITNSAMYYIANYNKTLLNFNDRKSGEYRSVVFSFHNKKVLSFSPPKSIPPSVFINKYPTIGANMLITDAIEGVMITLFFDNLIYKWEIATKGAVGGKYGYYGNVVKKSNDQALETPTFYRMFLDAFRANTEDELNDLPFLKYLPKNACYNFVLQHPNNVIALPIKEPSLYLVGVYTIDKNSVEYVPQNEYESWKELTGISGIIKFPKKYNGFIDNDFDYEDLEHIYSPGMTGIMVTNIETGERTKITSNKYEQLKNSIKIPTSSQYLYFCLRRINKVTDYLKFYPKNKRIFYKIRNEYEEFISAIHKLYMNVYVFQKFDLDEYSYYDKWCKKIHDEIFLPSKMKVNKTIITRKIVKTYFDDYEPRELLYIMNFDFR